MLNTCSALRMALAENHDWLTIRPTTGRTIQWQAYRGRMLRTTVRGPADGCQLKRSGSTLHADQKATPTPGGTSSTVEGAVSGTTLLAAMMATRSLHQWAVSLKGSVGAVR